MHAKRTGFTLIEMLVTIGIIVALVAAVTAAYSKIIKTAQRTKARELVQETALALQAMNLKTGAWAPVLLSGAQNGVLNERVAIALDGYMALNSEGGKLVGTDRFGLLSTWGREIVKAHGNSTTRGMIEKHLLHYAIDNDEDGIIKGVDVGGEVVNVRATAIVWCAGSDGVIEPYSKGIRSGRGVYSWSEGQMRGVQ